MRNRLLVCIVLCAFLFAPPAYASDDDDDDSGSQDSDDDLSDDDDNDDDDEWRRYQACILLEEYISQNYNNENVIVLGDWNDSLIDEEVNNVFWNFLSNPENYLFTDMNIAEGNQYYWSWGNGGSHLDHILITNELFDNFINSATDIQTILIDDYLSGDWAEYEQSISDHRPVALKLSF